ncbi:uncharacterized protein LOC110025905 [Phalaenopsis equestris]|uniref:uncharacterized protein LOC110025905 n=1 Tax=Phalaenopsis equestris TaxID=78828 RepID=UPI0009E2803B|nr:uncharacterized protein LOC110025905 [Phalaenopsis equestris]XP_020582257.1 uncharacterized protein LOC110025905 [Phalaenopsis equestris]XP_020582258.1 uncharacterized protein LOC110025905 [Phalaenopsis equestris]
MERFSSQLYEKYINLKKRRFSEIEESNKKIISETLQYQSASDHLIEDLKNENDNLREMIVSLLEQYQESQKLLLQERQKTKSLSIEVGTLKEKLAQKNDNVGSTPSGSLCGNASIRLEHTNGRLPMNNSPDTPSGVKPVQSENAAVILHEIDNENRLVPDCCRRAKTNYADGSCSPCAFHTLVEQLVGMKVSVECQTEGLFFSVIHQMSGYNFTLSWIRGNDEREQMLFYRVSSLGTLENIAHEWMKDDMIFSLAMCPVFFDRLSRVVGHKR